MERFFQIDNVPCRLDLKNPFQDKTMAVLRFTHKIDTDGDDNLDDEDFPAEAQLFKSITNPLIKSKEDINSIFLAFIEEINTYLSELFEGSEDAPEQPEGAWEQLEWLIEYGVQVDSKSLTVSF